LLRTPLFSCLISLSTSDRSLNANNEWQYFPTQGHPRILTRLARHSRSPRAAKTDRRLSYSFDPGLASTRCHHRQPSPGRHGVPRRLVGPPYFPRIQYLIDCAGPCGGAKILRGKACNSRLHPWESRVDDFNHVITVTVGNAVRPRAYDFDRFMDLCGRGQEAVSNVDVTQ
jgi:hypothetical protein